MHRPMTCGSTRDCPTRHGVNTRRCWQTFLPPPCACWRPSCAATSRPAGIWCWQGFLAGPRRGGKKGKTSSPSLLLVGDAQCKEVFDASAHLLPAAPPALLPDVSLTDIRPPSMPVARKAETGRSWGEPTSSPPPVAPSAVALSPASEKPAFSLFPAGTSDVMAGLPDAQAQVVAPVLEVPQPAVPAFLSAAAGAVAPGADAGIGPFTPFAWRPDSVRNVPTTGGDVAGMRSDAVALPPLAFPEVAADGSSSLPKGDHPT